MKKDGKGGGCTTTGLHFENKTNLLKSLCKTKGYKYVPDKKNGWTSILYNNKIVALSLQKYKLYNYLKSQNIEWEKHIKKRLLPDECIYIIKNKKLIVIEKKYQQTTGSVDEKLQTCHFKKKQYKKLLSKLTKNIEYIYLLGNWFKVDKYKDVLDYIKSVGCSYYFDNIENVIKTLGLPGVKDYKKRNYKYNKKI